MTNKLPQSALVLVILVIAMFFGTATVALAATCTSAASGNWNATATWSCGHVPLNTDDVVIASGHTVTILGGANTGQTLNINGSGILNFDDNANITLTIEGTVTNNGTIAMLNSPGNRQRTINVGGHWTNNGTFTALSPDGTDTSTVVFNGTIAQTIGGSASTSFYSLTINNTGSSVTLNTNASVSNVLTLTSDLTTSSGTLTQSGTCSGAGDLVGTVARSDQGTTTRCWGNANNQITFATGAGTPSGSVTVTLTKSTPLGFTDGNVVARYYTITSNSWTGSGTTLRLRYLQSELPTFTGGKTEADLVLFKYPNGGPKYVQQGGTVNTTDNYVTLTGVTSFSDWAFAASGSPTSLELGSFSARITKDHHVKIRWQSENELGIVGYNVLRSNKKNGLFKPLNPTLIYAKNAGSALSTSYARKDTRVKVGNKYFYKIELVRTSGAREETGAIRVKLK